MLKRYPDLKPEPHQKRIRIETWLLIQCRIRNYLQRGSARPIYLLPVLRIRDVYPGSEYFSSRIPDTHQKVFQPKKLFLSSRFVHPGSGSWFFTHPGSRCQKASDPRSATLSFTLDKFQEFLLKSEPGAAEPAALMRESRSLGCQTSPPPFHTEWEEAVRRTVWQPGYIPQPEPPGQFVTYDTRLPQSFFFS